MYMQPYTISYPNYGALQQPIACNSNLVKGNACTNIKLCENSNKQDSKYTQSRWCPLGFSHPKEKITTDVQARISGATSGGCTSKVNNYEEGMEAKASCFIVSLS